MKVEGPTGYFFKMLDWSRSGGFSNGWRWPPTGEWTPRINIPLMICVIGYHLLRPRDLWVWNCRYGRKYDSVYLVKAETEGMVFSNRNRSNETKVAVRRACLIKKMKFKKSWDATFATKESIREWMKFNDVELLD